MVVFLRYLQLGVFLAGLASAGLAYVMWQKNIDLNAELTETKEARKRDAVAAKAYIENLLAQREKLESSLDQLRRINDEEGRRYLDAPVPESVRRLFPD